MKKQRGAYALIAMGALLALGVLVSTMLVGCAEPQPYTRSMKAGQATAAAVPEPRLSVIRTGTLSTELMCGGLVGKCLEGR